MRTGRFYVAVIQLVALGLTGCATISLVDTTSEASVQAGLESKDRIYLETKDSQEYELRIVEVTDRGITGIDEEGVVVFLSFDDISTLHVHKSRPGMTAAAVTGVLALTATAARYPAIALAGVLLGWE